MPKRQKSQNSLKISKKKHKLQTPHDSNKTKQKHKPNKMKNTNTTKNSNLNNSHIAQTKSQKNE